MTFNNHFSLLLIIAAISFDVLAVEVRNTVMSG